MDTKLNRKSKRIGIIVSLLLLGILAVGAVLFYPAIGNASKGWLERYENNSYEEKIGYYERKIVESAVKSTLGAYWKLEQKRKGELVNPSLLYLPESINEWKESYDNGDIEEYTPDDNFASLGSAANQLDSIINRWYEESMYYSDTYHLNYTITDQEKQNFFSNNSEQKVSRESFENEDEITKAYDLFFVLEYDELGNISIPYSHGLNHSLELEIQNDNLKEVLFQSYMGTDEWNQLAPLITNPKNIQITFGIVKGEYYENIPIRNGGYEQLWAFMNAGYLPLAVGVVFLVLLLAVFLPYVKTWGIKESILSKIPLEISGLGILYAFVFMGDFMLDLAVYTTTLEFQNDLLTYQNISEGPATLIAFGANWLAWFAVLFICYLFFLTIRQLFTLSIKKFIITRTLTGRFLAFIIRGLQNFLRSLKEIDLREKTDKTLLKIVGINLLVLAVLCSFWFFGIMLLLVYSVLLFFFLKKYTADLKSKYNILLRETNKMAEGNLNICVEENLGVFNPLKEELQKVQQGFQKAVEEETKSQQMKTELITNVSHDLKTPLTAIITYISLLREENITVEERNSYLDTLDKKSIRLKYLIEDLFEVSKASSQDVILNPVEVDIASLIKQAALELEDKIEKAGIDFRYQFPEERVLLMLDSEKTFRIIENLMVNIIKYALPHSRAYVQVKEEAGKISIIFKNISATELDFEGEDITERFVRGDKSRSTEGSGLGLAIAKSFTEIQGGNFSIITDGDLFKAIILFFKPKSQEVSLYEEVSKEQS